MDYTIKLTTKKQRQEVKEIMERLYPGCIKDYSEDFENILDTKFVNVRFDEDGFYLNVQDYIHEKINLQNLRKFRLMGTKEIDVYAIVATHEGLSIGCERIDKKEAVRIAKDILEVFGGEK